MEIGLEDLLQLFRLVSPLNSIDASVMTRRIGHPWNQLKSTYVYEIIIVNNPHDTATHTIALGSLLLITPSILPTLALTR